MFIEVSQTNGIAAQNSSRALVTREFNGVQVSGTTTVNVPYVGGGTYINLGQTNSYALESPNVWTGQTIFNVTLQGDVLVDDVIEYRKVTHSTTAMESYTIGDSRASFSSFYVKNTFIETYTTYQPFDGIDVYDTDVDARDPRLPQQSYFARFGRLFTNTVLNISAIGENGQNPELDGFDLDVDPRFSFRETFPGNYAVDKVYQANLYGGSGLTTTITDYSDFGDQFYPTNFLNPNGLFTSFQEIVRSNLQNNVKKEFLYVVETSDIDYGDDIVFIPWEGATKTIHQNQFQDTNLFVHTLVIAGSIITASTGMASSPVNMDSLNTFVSFVKTNASEFTIAQGNLNYLSQTADTRVETVSQNSIYFPSVTDDPDNLYDGPLQTNFIPYFFTETYNILAGGVMGTSSDRFIYFSTVALAKQVLPFATTSAGTEGLPLGTGPYTSTLINSVDVQGQVTSNINPQVLFSFSKIPPTIFSNVSIFGAISSYSQMDSNQFAYFFNRYDYFFIQQNAKNAANPVYVNLPYGAYTFYTYFSGEKDQISNITVTGIQSFVFSNDVFDVMISRANLIDLKVAGSYFLGDAPDNPLSSFSSFYDFFTIVTKGYAENQKSLVIPRPLKKFAPAENFFFSGASNYKNITDFTGISNSTNAASNAYIPHKFFYPYRESIIYLSTTEEFFG